MNDAKKPFNRRAFIAMMAALTGVGLPISGLLLHASSGGHFRGGGHVWTVIHVLLGILFTVFVTGHIILNRRPIGNYLKANAAGRLPLSREACWAAIIMVAIVVVMLAHSLPEVGR